MGGGGEVGRAFWAEALTWGRAWHFKDQKGQRDWKQVLNELRTVYRGWILFSVQSGKIFKGAIDVSQPGLYLEEIKMIALEKMLKGDKMEAWRQFKGCFTHGGTLVLSNIIGNGARVRWWS